MNPLVTVVIPSCLRQARLQECLFALAQQKLSLSQFEVIVVDQMASRATAAVVQKMALQTGLSIRYVSQRRNSNLAAACNRGWQLANSLFVAFMNETCLPQPLWLTTALPLFHEGAQVLVGQVQHPFPAHPVRSSAGANLFCRRALLDEVGGFDEMLDRRVNPDLDWLNRLAKADIPVLSCPDAVVVCPARKTPWLSALRFALSKLILTLTITLSVDTLSLYERCKTSNSTPGPDLLSGWRQQLHLALFSKRREENARQAYKLP